MRNSRTNIAYVLNTQFCTMINPKAWNVDESKSDDEKKSTCLNLFLQTVL